MALDDRLVSFSDMALTETNLPTLQKEQVRDVVAQISKAMPEEDRVIALDRVLAYVDKSQITPKNVEGLNTDPPPIFFSQTPAVLVNIDGDPIWSPIKENDLKFAVNTNWDLYFHEPSKTYYLLNDGSWLKTSDLKGSWAPAGKLPESFKKLPADDNFKDATAAVPGKKLSAKQGAEGVREPRARRADPHPGRPEVPPGGRHDRPAVGVQHRGRRLPDGQGRPGLLPGGRPVVLGAGLRRAVDVRHAEPARRTSRRSRSSTRGRACWPRCRARSRRPKRSCSRRSRRRPA